MRFRKQILFILLFVGSMGFCSIAGEEIVPAKPVEQNVLISTNPGSSQQNKDDVKYQFDQRSNTSADTGNGIKHAS
jgi:hypothetical protein